MATPPNDPSSPTPGQDAKPSSTTPSGVGCSAWLGDGHPPTILDTGLNENELIIVRQYLRLSHPEIANTSMLPSKSNTPDDLVGHLEFGHAKQESEFHATYRQLYTLAKQYMDALGNPKAAKFELCERAVQHQLMREFVRS